MDINEFNYKLLLILDEGKSNSEILRTATKRCNNKKIKNEKLFSKTRDDLCKNYPNPKTPNDARLRREISDAKLRRDELNNKAEANKLLYIDKESKKNKVLPKDPNDPDKVPTAFYDDKNNILIRKSSLQGTKPNSNGIIWKHGTDLKDPIETRRLIYQNTEKNGIELFKFITRHNAGRPSPNKFDIKFRKDCIFDAVLSFNKGESDSVYSIYSGERKESLKKHNLFPFAMTPNGDLICSKPGGIYLYELETENAYKIAINIATLENMLHK